ncbi:MAG: hypothetical protein NC218_01430 [Acetobacter sp.]|nr:hypothetical protein [Acetobacter sp.]
MARERVDGNKFQSEVETAAQKIEQPVFVIRLRTPQARQANVRNIADFILFGRTTQILEVKETGDKSFSLNTFQQKQEVEKFQKFFEEAKVYYNFQNDRPYRVAALVHFIREGKYTLYYMEDSPFVVMHPDDKNCLTWTSLKEAIQYIVTQ